MFLSLQHSGRVLMVILASVLFVGTGSLSLGTKLPDSSLRRSRMMHLLAPVCASFVLFLLLKPYGSPQSRSTGVVLVDPGTGRHEVQNLLPGSTVVIPARFEADYLVKTIFYTFEYTPPDLLAEILVVDDNSEHPLEPLVVQSFEEGGVLQSLTPEQKAKIRILRLPQREGLIRAKIIGADSARGTYILFLDGHCRVVPGYMQSMINMITSNGYKTIVTPIVTNVNGTSWEHMSLSGGAKMMFEWNFEFYWFEDNNDEVPIAVGGIQLMTKRWWTESGGYDQGMLDWGGENIEQSLRVWMCGGKILVDRQAKIGHIFQRPAPKNKVRSGQVQRNHARAALLYLDEKLSWFLDNHAAARSEISKHQLGPHIGDRLAVRHSLQCKSFDEGFMERFWSVFENQALLLDKVHLIKHKRSRLCLALVLIAASHFLWGTSLHLSPQLILSLDSWWRNLPHSIYAQISAIVGLLLDSYYQRYARQGCQRSG
ncbi:UDP-N-acetyl-D-galactosamine:polypeptide N-acetylgalactosaminyltransferase T4, putative [Perkinsus marinus ATCC 50983]|uniref:UDP-N-acetyl-D-galactosamine:polypeptide N-acetylgalactosaminyltransferase T4, putative n=1 Tax=Perkinsus marinus (strain ATCC 50983 / TXsc) TaxID=423536 RepID=C5LH35_PERM5|nr:UDP-N-acetyl-D-galactosamine:polypeptide N-acetylgalactosaminyltransferase T4, putative [Perkinsus marinus ATCC 50983]EER03844.1 UDP-N-acetyl-D-galactosamine:polypeptide N-acetylgalactosaminyltransferase T4, putative [Perkinsus marinus ATCC 50983]|eukprot:XP_002772028.1 UDP-N-acetyl-D-galactosamine:polypeptide N-acetylgalactosaminyltransferase T4, putative [Perkinsus marinus ATCC 50983]